MRPEKLEPEALRSLNKYKRHTDILQAMLVLPRFDIPYIKVEANRLIKGVSQSFDRRGVFEQTADGGKLTPSFDCQ